MCIPSNLKMVVGYGLGSGPHCTFCPSLALDPLGHHAIPCKHESDVVSRHNKLCYVFVECCRRVNVSAQVEAGSGFGMTNATLDQQMFWSPTGLLGSQLHLISLLPHC